MLVVTTGVQWTTQPNDAACKLKCTWREGSSRKQQSGTPAKGSDKRPSAAASQKGNPLWTAWLSTTRAQVIGLRKVGPTPNCPDFGSEAIPQPTTNLHLVSEGSNTSKDLFCNNKVSALKIGEEQHSIKNKCIHMQQIYLDMYCIYDTTVLYLIHYTLCKWFCLTEWSTRANEDPTFPLQASSLYALCTVQAVWRKH